MPQHFLLTAEARSLSVRDVFALSDEAAFDLFRELRSGKGEEVVCPECGVVERHWFLPSRRQWRCKACAHTFSVTSGTIFAHHKLPLRVYLGAVAIYTNAVKGLSALQMCRDLGVQYKTDLPRSTSRKPLPVMTIIAVSDFTRVATSRPATSSVSLPAPASACCSDRTRRH